MKDNFINYFPILYLINKIKTIKLNLILTQYIGINILSQINN